MALLLFLLPLLFAVVAVAIPSERLRPWIVTAGGLVQLGPVTVALLSPRVEGLGGWLVLDPLGRLVLGFTTILFAVCALYVPGYLAQRKSGNARIFCTCVLCFFGVVTLITETHHLGLLWVAMEASTLTAAPLLYYHRTQRSLEAVWKYLLIGSVGIALALMGCFFLGYAALAAGREPSLHMTDLIRNAPAMSRSWLHAAFVFLLVGYGTKMGLAPMHTWKPDAYGEAPGVVGTLLAGGLTSAAFLAILRVYRVCVVAGERSFAQKPMIALGLVSMLVAAVFMARQKDYKRMLAYSSVEHMGILVLGIGIGGVGVFGALLHMVNNGLTKGVLFLSAGNIHRAYGSKSTDDVRGALRRTPWSAALLLTGFFAITGSPPFGPFLSEFTIINAAITKHHYVVVGLFLLALIVVFIGMGATILSVVQGEPDPRPEDAPPIVRERILTVLPSCLLILLVLLLGVYIPRPLSDLLHQAASALEGP
jgi:hydrogenase-4 component F